MTSHELAEWLLKGADAPVKIVLTPGPFVADIVTQYSGHDITTRGEVKLHFENWSKVIVLLIAEHTSK